MRTSIVESVWGEDGGLTQLHFFCSKGMTSSVIRMLEMKSIDVEARRGGREDGMTCLMTAALIGHLDLCRLLIDKGADIEAKSSSGWTSLNYAARYGHIEIVRLLCDHGAEIEARTNSGWRPLHFAVSHGRMSIVKELIEVRNADINARTDRGRTALRLARDQGKDDIASYLLCYGGIV